MLLSLSTRRNWRLSVSTRRLGMKWGRKTRAKKVVPTSASEAKRPKSRSRLLSVNSRLQKAPTVVMHPMVTGVASSSSIFSGSPVEKWCMVTCRQ